MNRSAMSSRGHWYRIRLLGSVLESALEQERTLKAMRDGMTERAKAAVDRLNRALNGRYYAME